MVVWIRMHHARIHRNLAINPSSSLSPPSLSKPPFHYNSLQPLVYRWTRCQKMLATSAGGELHHLVPRSNCIRLVLARLCTRCLILVLVSLVSIKTACSVACFPALINFAHRPTNFCPYEQIECLDDASRIQ